MGIARLVAFVALVLSVIANPNATSAVNSCGRLRADGRSFVCANGQRFQWRGVTAFRLAEQVAHGEEKKAEAYLDWARRTGFNTVRVFSTLCCWFDLRADDGQRALPRLLELAASRNLYVQVVALTSTVDRPIDLEAQVRAVAAIAEKHDNAIVEIANEPAHPTQDPRLSRNGFAGAEALGRLVPAGVLYTVGTGNDDGPVVVDGRPRAEPPEGRFVTRHLARLSEPWAMILRMRRLAEMSALSGKPVLSGEPIGADEVTKEGRRLADPAFFFAYGAACRLLEIGCNFHLEDGLHAIVSRPTQAAAAAAFIAGTGVVPVDRSLTFVPADSPDAPAQLAGACSSNVLWSGRGEDSIGLIVGDGCAERFVWRGGWKMSGKIDRPYPAVAVVRASKMTS